MMMQRKPVSVSADAPLSQELLTLRFKALWRAFRSEHYAFIAISLYLIFEYIKPEQAYPVLGAVPWVRLCLLTALAGFFADKQAKSPGTALTWLLVLFLLHCLFSSIFAYSPEYSFSRFSIVFLWVLIYWLITALVNTERRLYLFFAAYLLCNLKMSQFGFISWASRGFTFATWGLTGAGWFRNSGEFGMQMSMFFAYTLCLAFFLRQYWHGWRKWLMYFMPFSAVACVVGSSSRGAIIGSLAVLFYLSMFSKSKFKAWAGSVVAIAIAYYFMPPQFLARFHSAGEDATSLSRLFYWAKAREMMAAHPILGVGYYNWVPYYRDHYFDPTLYWRVEEAHNTYLQLGAELGYLGLALFVAMILASFIINWQSERACRRPGFEFLRGLSMGMNAAGIGLVLASTFLTAYFMPNYWIHFALTVVVRNVVRKKIAAAANPTLATAEELPAARRRSLPRYGPRQVIS